MNYRSLLHPTGCAGRLKITGEHWLDTTVKADGSDAFDILMPTRSINLAFAGYSALRQHFIAVLSWIARDQLCLGAKRLPPPGHQQLWGQLDSSSHNLALIFILSTDPKVYRFERRTALLVSTSLCRDVSQSGP
jgi:hypothetical protein